jgi:hypothetical protein
MKCLFILHLNIKLPRKSHHNACKQHYNKMHPCMPNDFIAFWMNSLVPLNGPSWDVVNSLVLWTWTNELHPRFVVVQCVLEDKSFQSWCPLLINLKYHNTLVALTLIISFSNMLKISRYNFFKTKILWRKLANLWKYCKHILFSTKVN